MISHCCHAPLKLKIERLNPLNGMRYGEILVVDACKKCGEKCEAIKEDEE